MTAKYHLSHSKFLRLSCEFDSKTVFAKKAYNGKYWENFLTKKFNLYKSIIWWGAILKKKNLLPIRRKMSQEVWRIICQSISKNWNFRQTSSDRIIFWHHWSSEKTLGHESFHDLSSVLFSKKLHNLCLKIRKTHFGLRKTAQKVFDKAQFSRIKAFGYHKLARDIVVSKKSQRFCRKSGKKTKTKFDYPPKGE